MTKPLRAALLSVLAPLTAAAAFVGLAACSAPAPGTCSPGFTRCEENRYETCDDNGNWQTTQDCAASQLLCNTDSGCETCFPDTKQCDGQDVVRCRPDGSGFDVLASCDGTQHEECSGGQCLNACEVAAATRDYEGCDYWAVDLDNAVESNLGSAAAQQYSVVVSNASDLDADVKVEIWCTPDDAKNPATPCTPGEPYVVRDGIHLGPGDLKIIDLDPREVDGSTSPVLNDGPGTFESSHAYHVVSNAPLIAYQFNPLDNVGVFSNDASLLLPSEALSDSYLVSSWPQTVAQTSDPNTNLGENLRTFLTIVGIEDDTTVDVGLTARVLGGGGVRAANAGETLTVHLDRFDVVNLETDEFNADFTGTNVHARDLKKIAVFTGSEASDSPRFDTLVSRQCCADHLEEQAFPEDSLGTHFVAIHTPSRSKLVDEAGWDVAVIPQEPEWWRVLASRDNTVITTNLPPPQDSITLMRGANTIIESPRDFLLTSSAPIVFSQVPGSQFVSGIPSTLPDGERPPGGDPSLIYIPPVEQWRDTYLFLVPNKYAFDTVLIAAPTSAHMLYDGLPIDMVTTCEHTPIGTQEPPGGGDPVEYVAIRCQLSFPMPGGAGTQDDGVHLLQAMGGEKFGLVVWGWDSFVSYGYPAGSNVERINVQ
ncbi:MAG TPA: IgGFc-binding protein [Kofleriaceae bacterium]|nr:IgGFc-binding protein [Kofleriaceae bacterium]